MGKISSYSTATPVSTDYLIGDQASGPTTKRFQVSTIANTNIMTVPYKFDAYRHNSYTLTASVLTKMPYDTEAFDTGNNFDSVTNYRFTAPVGGFYQFNANVFINSATVRLGLQFLKNGAEFGGRQDSNASTISVSSSIFCQLSANDYIEVWYFCGGTPAVTIDVTRFSGYLVSIL